MSFDICMKLKLDYSIFALQIQFFPDSLEFQVNQENIHPTLTILKDVWTLKMTVLIPKLAIVLRLYQ